MPVLLPRSAWTDTPRPVSALTRLTAPRGFAVHWPGITEDRIDATNQARIAARLESYRRLHVNGNGWTDIAYQVAFDQAGRAWDARGTAYKSAGNGDQAVNSSHGAVLLLLGDNESPSDAMVGAVCWWRTTMWLPLFPHATAVVGHRDLHATNCPGTAAYRLVTAGTFTRHWTPADEPDEEERTMVFYASARDTNRVFAVVPAADGPRSAYVPNPHLLRPALHRIEFATEAALHAVYPSLNAQVVA